MRELYTYVHVYIRIYLCMYTYTRVFATARMDVCKVKLQSNIEASAAVRVLAHFSPLYCLERQYRGLLGFYFLFFILVLFLF